MSSYEVRTSWKKVNSVISSRGPKELSVDGGGTDREEFQVTSVEGGDKFCVLNKVTSPVFVCSSFPYMAFFVNKGYPSGSLHQVSFPLLGRLQAREMG